MEKPMTPEEKTKWAQKRAKGPTWYIFVSGIIGYGIPWALGMAAFVYFSGYWHGLRVELISWTVGAILFGILAGWFIWRKRERRFRETEASG
jgi:hypothetical protein